MKEIFFKGLVVALPVLMIGGLVYLVFHGFYSFYADIRLKRELDQISRESAERRKNRPRDEKTRETTPPEDLFA